MSTVLESPILQYEHSSCALCGLKSFEGKFMFCSKCRLVVYCSKEHQVAHWKRHKRLCREHAWSKDSPHGYAAAAACSVSVCACKTWHIPSQNAALPNGEALQKFNPSQQQPSHASAFLERGLSNSNVTLLEEVDLLYPGNTLSNDLTGSSSMLKPSLGASIRDPENGAAFYAEGSSNFLQSSTLGSVGGSALQGLDSKRGDRESAYLNGTEEFGKKIPFKGIFEENQLLSLADNNLTLTLPSSSSSGYQPPLEDLENHAPAVPYNLPRGSFLDPEQLPSSSNGQILSQSSSSPLNLMTSGGSSGGTINNSNGSGFSRLESSVSSGPITYASPSNPQGSLSQSHSLSYFTRPHQNNQFQPEQEGYTTTTTNVGKVGDKDPPVADRHHEGSLTVDGICPSMTSSSATIPFQHRNNMQPLTGQTSQQTRLWMLHVWQQQVIEDLNRYGVCVVDNLLGDSRGAAVLREVQSMYSSGAFQDGQLVKAKDYQSKSIRGDKITWVDGREPTCKNIAVLIKLLDNIVMGANNVAENGKLGSYKIKERSKAMVACYPGSGTHYVKHVDNPNDDGRCVTAIYYLNKDWNTRENGGLLRIFPEGWSHQVADIEPLFDRVIFFWSDRRNPHEVQPAFKTRYAITLWYFDSNARARAMISSESNKLMNLKSLS